ncbi:hypothetical protein [Absidia glauca]|uniref:FHA domain-containing protein n=1 Tax=Absidia glauca TaxID=4829 RepID=A0A163K1G5_ABSGL|nr:hypothetical protein [Absidia glauca]
MPNTDKWVNYFAAQKAYLEHNPCRAAQCHTSSPHAPTIIFHGTKTSRLTIGRGNGNGVQVGRRNPRMSRQHLIIEHKPHTGFTLTVKSPNGVLVDHIMFMDGEHIPLVKGSLIEVLGTRLIFGGEKLQLQHDGDGQGQPMDMDTPLSPATTDTNATKAIAEETDGPVKKTTPTTTTAAATVAALDTDLSATMDTGSDTTNRSKVTTTPSDPLLPVAPSKPLDFLDTLIRLLANSRKTSMTVSEIGRQLKRERQSLMHLIHTTACIGCIERTGNTADGTPKEHLYYYKPELDANDERRLALSQSRRGARKCALKDTQYYFRIPPKLPNHRTKPVDSKRKLHRDPQQSRPPKKIKQSVKRAISSTPTLSTSTPPITTSSPLSLSSDDLSDDGFLSSDDECSDKELTALFQDV